MSKSSYDKSLDKLSKRNKQKLNGRLARSRSRALRHEKEGYSGVHEVSLFSMFSLILISMLIISLAQFLNSGTSDISFLSFLEFLSNAPSFDVSWSMIELSIVGDWGLFEFLRTFINYFTSIFEVLILIFGFLVETIEYVLYFVRGLLFP